MKTNLKNTKAVKLPLKAALILMTLIMAAVVPMQVMNRRVLADQYDDKIAALQADVAAYEAQAAELAAKADSLEVAVAELQNQVNAIQAQIAVTQAEYDKLIAQIAETEKKIQDNKDTLGQTVADMYVDGKITPLEMLASSKNIGDYLDKQEYQSSIRDQLSSTIAEIKTLKESLTEQKAKVEVILLDQKQQGEVLAAKKTEQQALLNETKGSEAAYQNLINSNNETIKAIRAEQAAYFASISNQSSIVLLAGDANKGGYPSYYANSYQDTVVDAWGMYNRECVSYTSWKVHEAHINHPEQYRHDMPYWGGIGNAWQWAFSGWAATDSAHYGMQVDSSYPYKRWHEANASNYGIPSGTTPKIGSVAVMNGEYGHVAWVEAIDGNKITISQYNWYLPNNGGWGQHSEMVVDSTIFQKYIYFGEW